MPLPPTAAAEFAALRGRLSSLAVLLDVDGTLAPISDRWDESLVPGETREIVGRLVGRAGLVALVSGRPLTDLVRMMGRSDLPAAGNHGLELRRQGEQGGPLPEVAVHRPALDELVARWRGRFDAAAIGVEDKGATMSFHYRTAADPSAAADLLMGPVAADARGAGLRTTTGRMVLEIRPPVDADKGTAVEALLEGRDDLEIGLFIGDDSTDADAWRALGEMVAAGRLSRRVAVLVRSAETADGLVELADLVVDGTAGAAAALAVLAGE